MRPENDGCDAGNNVFVRRYSGSDAAAVSAICQSSPQVAQWTRENFDGAASSGQIVLVAEVEGAIRGFLVCRVAANESELLNMAVDNAYRRQGVGASLLSRAQSETETLGAREMYLEVRESNGGAIAFYENQGFCKMGERRNYYRAPTENAVLMTKILTD